MHVTPVEVTQTWLYGGSVLLRVLKVEGRRCHVVRIGHVVDGQEQGLATPAESTWWNNVQLQHGGRLLAYCASKFDVYLATCPVWEGGAK